MNKYVADTMAIVLYLESRKLPQSVKTLFENANNGSALIYISAVTLMEIGYLAEKSRIDTSLTDVIGLTRQNKNFMLFDLNFDAITQGFKIKNIPELHDRMIAASAITLNADLITNDPVITRSGKVTCIW